MPDDDFKAAVGLSRKWDARTAGREVARDTLEKLGEDPDFVLLFATIHYKKHGGFQELLNGVWDILPEGTPLIGGTVTGFMNPQGCFTRGTSALAVSYPEMDIVIGIGRNTKRNPRNAAITCADMITKGLEKSKYKTNFLIDLISAGMVPQIPGMGRKRIIRGLASKAAVLLSSLSLKTVQKGVGREDELFEVLIPKLKEFKILSGSSMDDMKILSNYQFFNKEVASNVIVSLGIKTDLECDIFSAHCLKKTGKKFKVTKFQDKGRVISKINNKPAVDELLRILNWPENYLDERVYRKIFYYPIAFSDGEKLIPEVIGIFLGDSFLGTYMVKNSEVHILSASGINLLSAVDENIEYFNGVKPLFGLISSCGIRLETLGPAVYSVRDKLLNFFKESPFLLYYVGGEAVYTPERGIYYGNDTFNLSVFSDPARNVKNEKYQ